MSVTSDGGRMEPNFWDRGHGRKVWHHLVVMVALAGFMLIVGRCGQ